MKTLTIDNLKEHKIIPVLIIDKLEDADFVMKALLKGGIRIVEITFRTEVALEVLKYLKQNFTDVVIGAGTILSLEQAKQAIEAGVDFIVSPGFDEKIVSYCIENETLIIPGTSNATDMSKAVKHNLKIVKFFPANIIGGINAIKAYSQPFNQLYFIPTGGINYENLEEYLSFEKVLACGGSWMVKKDLINNKDFEKISTLSRDAVNLIERKEL